MRVPSAALILMVELEGVATLIKIEPSRGSNVMTDWAKVFTSTPNATVRLPLALTLLMKCSNGAFQLQTQS